MGDFDFFVGTRDVTNRRLRKRHVGSDDWDEFPGISVAHSFFDGAGSFDEIRFPTRGFSGSTVRILDPSTGLCDLLDEQPATASTPGRRTGSWSSPGPGDRQAGGGVVVR